MQWLSAQAVAQRLLMKLGVKVILMRQALSGQQAALRLQTKQLEDQVALRRQAQDLLAAMVEALQTRRLSVEGEALPDTLGMEGQVETAQLVIQHPMAQMVPVVVEVAGLEEMVE